MRLNAAEIAARIPHHGRMCLLDGVLDWSDQHICCEARSHTAADHPLRHDGCLSSVHGIEYAAQAMAVHGALLAGADDAPRKGYLTSVRSVQLHQATLDADPAPLMVEATRLSGDGQHILYSFVVRQADRTLLDGRASVVLDADAHTSPIP